MKTPGLPLLLLLPLLLPRCSTAAICTEKTCVYDFEVSWIRTLTYRDEQSQATFNVEPAEGALRVHSDSVGFSMPMMGNRSVPAEEVITADGLIRNALSINGQFPGPTLEVMEGAEVIVKVHNRLPTEAVTVHWHGIHQHGTANMDGVPYVTQCPIPPAGSFTYTFKAHPAGTHWYHSHLMNQRQDGLFGAMIIHRQAPTIPYFVLAISDWYLYDAGTIHLMNSGTDEMVRHMRHTSMHHSKHGNSQAEIHNVLINGRGRTNMEEDDLPLSVIEAEKGKKVKIHAIHAGADFGVKLSIDKHRLTIVSSDGFDIEPVEVDQCFIFPGEAIDFEVTANADGEKFWLRALEEMLHESMPGHEHVMAQGDPEDMEGLHVHMHRNQEDGIDHSAMNHTAMGHAVRRKRSKHSGHHSRKSSHDDADSQAEQTGHEGHDMSADQGNMDHGNMDHGNMDHGNMDHGNMDHENMDHENMDHENMDHENMDHGGMNHDMGSEGRAIFSYTTSTDPFKNPSSEPSPCPDTGCVIFNCPSRLDVAPNSGIRCINVDMVNGSEATNKELWNSFNLDQTADAEIVFNFILSGTPGASGSSVNGRKFLLPQEDSQARDTCNGCSECSCTHVINMPADKVVDLVLSNVQGDQPIYSHHPIHLHGYSFAVLYVGYPTHDASTGWQQAEGILCKDRFCNTVVKSYIHASKRHVMPAAYNTQNPPIKNTILVPARGYVVVRIRTDNPGTWFMHCHVDQHLTDGMGLLLHTLTKDGSNPLRNAMRSCRGQTLTSVPEIYLGQVAPPPSMVSIEPWVIVTMAVGLVLVGALLAVSVIYVVRKTSTSESSARL